MKEHYFKQKIYQVDRLRNRELYIEESIKASRARHKKLFDSLKDISVNATHELKNIEEKKRLRANKEFSENFWKKLKQSRSR